MDLNRDQLARKLFEIMNEGRGVSESYHQWLIDIGVYGGYLRLADLYMNLYQETRRGH